MYFILDRFGALHPCRWVEEYPRLEGVSFLTGRRITLPLLDPLEIVLKPLDLYSDDHGAEIPEYLKGSIPLLRRDLIDSLVAGGVDNLDLYDAVLINPDDGSRHTDHKAVNIIGAIAAANLALSDATVHPGGAVIDVDFDRLVLDESRTRGELLFRLAESINGILVHERLKKHLQRSGFENLEFLRPDEVAL